MKKILTLTAGLFMSVVSANADYDRDYQPFWEDDQVVKVDSGDRKYDLPSYYEFYYNGKWNGRDYYPGYYYPGYYNWVYKTYNAKKPKTKDEMVKETEANIATAEKQISEMPAGRNKNHAEIELKHAQLYLEQLKANDEKDTYFNTVLAHDAKENTSMVHVQHKAAMKSGKKAEGKKDDKKAEEKKDEKKPEEKKDEKKPEETKGEEKVAKDKKEEKKEHKE